MTKRIRQREALADATAGVIASLVALWTFYPIDLHKISVQASSSNSSSRSSHTSRKQPISSYFRGIQVKTLHTASSSFCYFYIYSWIFSWWRARHVTSRSINTAEAAALPVSPLSRLALSAVAAMLNTTLTLPLDVLSANHQANTTMNDETEEVILASKSPQDGINNNRTRTMDHVWQEIVDKDDSEDNEDTTHLQHTLRRQSSFFRLNSLGIPGKYPELWKGIWPSLLLCSNPAIHYTLFDVLKGWLMWRKQQPQLSSGSTQQNLSHLNMSEAFLLGLLAKLSATLATYPLIRVKILLMVTSQRSMLQCLLQEYKHDGIAGLYRGWQYQLCHTVLKSALLMMVRERIAGSARRAIVR